MNHSLHILINEMHQTQLTFYILDVNCNKY